MSEDLPKGEDRGAGALHGACAVPERWWEALERGPRGREHALDLGRRLARLDPA